MELAKIYVSESCAQVISKKPIPAGLVGGYIDVVYAEDLWADLSKTVVFRSNITRDVVTDGRRVPVPADVLAAGVRLWVGFFGVAGDKALPTFWASLGTVGEAADPSGDESTDPNLPVWAQILDKTAELEQKVEREYQPKGDYLESSQLQPAIDTALAQAKESGVFDGPPGKDGADGQPGEDGKDGQDGAPGKDGIDGQDGLPGKSAYEYAKDGGYTGTEEEFAAKLAEENQGGADWNAAEGEPGHVKNRTHWTDRNETVYFPEGTYSIEDDPEDIKSDGYGCICSPDAFSEFKTLVEVGKKYLVRFDGSNYDVTGKTYDHDLLTNDFVGKFAYIGNLALLSLYMDYVEEIPPQSVDTGEPFFFLVYPGDTEAFYRNDIFAELLFSPEYADRESLEFGIKEVDETVHKLPNEYLPDGIGSADWNAAEGQPGHVLNRTHWVETVTVDPTFDGDMTGKESVQIDADPVAYAVKVSSDVVSVVELIGATIDVKSTSGDYTISVTSEIAMDAQNVFGVSGAVVLQGGTPAVISLTEDCEIQGFSLTSGTWFMCVPGVLYIASLSCLKSGEVEIVHKLPEKFLPMDEIAAHVRGTLPTWNGGSY